MIHEERPIDNRIPEYWRNGYKNLAGKEPTFDEYQKNPLLWSDKVPTTKELIKTFLVLGFVITLTILYLYLSSPHP